MKTKLYTFLLILLTANIGFSQSWSPFVLNQNSYYKQQHDNLAKVENFLLDSISKNGNNEVLYFNAKSNLKPDCLKNIKAKLKNMDWSKRPNKIDSLIRINDSILFITHYSSEPDTFIFKPLAKLNDTWITNGITIKCSKLGVKNIFSHQDSIKTYTCTGNGYDGIEFVLSKNNGFIKFLPLNEFFNHSNSSNFPPYFELIGYSNKTTSAGYKQPDFSDYFHLEAGDVLYWQDYSNPADITQPGSTKYHVDSITTAYISIDSVHYDYTRTNYDENGSISNVENHSSYHLRKDEGVIVQNNISWFGLKYGTQPSEIFFLQSLHFEIENDDTITYIQYKLPKSIVDTTNCRVNIMYDFDSTVEFSTREGKTFQRNYSGGENSTTLMGSILNGVQHGNTKIPTGVEDITFNDIKIYPNPFNDYINIDFYNHISLIEIFDATGNLILKSKIIKKTINLNNLSTGTYIVKITDSKNTTRQFKLLKK